MMLAVSQVVKYGGHSLKSSGAVNLTLNATYSELENTIMLHQMLNNDVVVKAKLVGQRKPLMLGTFRINGLSTSGDGCSTIKLNGLNAYVEMDNLNLLPTEQDGDVFFVVRYEAEIELEGGEEDGKE